MNNSDVSGVDVAGVNVREDCHNFYATREQVVDLQQQMMQIQKSISQMLKVSAEIRQLVGPSGITFPDGTILTLSIHGQKYFLDPEDSILTPHMLLYRQWEPELSRLIKRCLTKDSFFIDVGANIGYFTCLAAHSIGVQGSGSVFAFEPNSHLRSILEKNVAINWSSARVRIFSSAVSESGGEAVLYVPRSKGVNGSLAKLPRGGDFWEERVSKVMLDDVVKLENQDVLLKIDIEGFELAALRGASSLLDMNPKASIVMEWSKSQMRAANIAPGDVIDFLANRGFCACSVELARTEDGARGLLSWETLEKMDYGNIFLSRSV